MSRRTTRLRDRIVRRLLVARSANDRRVLAFGRGGRMHRRLLCVFGYREQVRVRWRGSVQGVGFRRWLAKRARTEGIRGWVRNRDEDTVDALLAGHLAGIERVLRKAWVGPADAEVEHVRLRFSDEEDVPLGFRIRRDKSHTVRLGRIRASAMPDVEADDDLERLDEAAAATAGTVQAAGVAAASATTASAMASGVAASGAAASAMAAGMREPGPDHGWRARLRRALRRPQRFDSSALLRSQDTAGYVERAMQHLGPIVKRPNTYRRAKVKNPFIAFRQVAKSKDLAFTHFGADPINIYTIRQGATAELFTTGMSSRITTPLRVLINNKELTKAWLAAHGLPVAQGGVVTDVEQGLALFEQLERDVVVKPIIGYKGRGISVGLRDPEDFRSAFTAAQAYNARVLVEETIRGVDLRVVVIDGTARAAVLRVPANVVGDGRTSVSELVIRKNRERQRNPHLALRPLRIDDNALRLLRAQGLSPQAQPALGQRVFLTLTANLAAGGDSISVFERLHPGIVALAESAAQSFGRALYLGVDILLERIDAPPDGQRCALCEINTNASPNVTYYPAYGAGFDAATAVVEHALARARRNPSAHEASFLVHGPTHVPSFERWLTSKSERSARVEVDTRADGALLVRARGPQRAVERLGDALWTWPGIGGARVDGVRRLSPPFTPTSAGIAQDVRPPAATRGDAQRLLDATLPHAGDHRDPDAPLLAAAFERRGWRARPRGEGWYVISDGATTGLFGAVQAGLAVTRGARLRFPLLRWLSDAGYPTPRHAVFTHDQLDLARAYHRWRGVPQRLGWVWEGPAWQRRVTSEDEVTNAWGTWPEVAHGELVDVEERRAVRNRAWDEWHQRVRELALDDEDALARAWGTWPLRVRGLVLEDDLAGAAVPVVVVAGRGEVIVRQDAPGSGIDEAARDACRQRAEAVVRSLPSVDLAVVWLRVGGPTGDAREDDWAVVDVDCTPALHRLDDVAAGAAARTAERVVDALALSDRTFWFGAGRAPGARVPP